MATTASGQAKLAKMVASGMGKQQALNMLIGAQKKATSTGGGASPAGSAGTEAGTVADQQQAIAQLGSASSIGDILASPEYSQALSDYFYSTYAPGLASAQQGIDAANLALIANEGDRKLAQGEAVRRVAGNYASRGMRTPEMVNKSIGAVKQPYQKASAEEKAAIKALENAKALQYGEIGANAGANFFSNPMLYGAVGAGARQSALSNASGLVGKYNLTNLAGGFTAGQKAAQDAGIAPKSSTPATTTKTTMPDMAEIRRLLR